MPQSESPHESGSRAKATRRARNNGKFTTKFSNTRAKLIDNPYNRAMCRNIKTLFNFEPPATSDEVLASSLQFVRKLSGFSKPSKANEATFELAVERVSSAAQELLNSLVTNAPPRDREIEAERAKVRSAQRFGLN